MLLLLHSKNFCTFFCTLLLATLFARWKNFGKLTQSSVTFFCLRILQFWRENSNYKFLNNDQKNMLFSIFAPKFSDLAEKSNWKMTDRFCKFWRENSNYKFDWFLNNNYIENNLFWIFAPKFSDLTEKIQTERWQIQSTLQKYFADFGTKIQSN